MSQSSTDFYDEEFGFKCKRINRRRLQSVVSTTTNEDDHNDQENIIGHNYDYDNDNDLNNKDTSNKKRSKGKGVSTGNTFKQVDFNYLRNPVLSPISPYTPHSQEQQLPSSFITVTTLSPEHTGPQTAHDTTTPTFDSTLLYDIDSTDNVDFTFEESEPVTPPTLAQPSLELLPPDETEVPNFERLRNQLIKTWQHNIEKRLFNVDGIDDTDENDLRRAMEKLANHDFSPYVSQHSDKDELELTYVRPNPSDERNRIKIDQYKKVFAVAEKEKEQRRQWISEVYNYHAMAQDTYPQIEAKDNLGSYEDYIDHLDSYEGDFMQSTKQILDNISTTIDTNSTQQPDQEKKLRGITELRQQLSSMYEQQKESGESADRLMKEIANKLKQDMLRFPTLTGNNNNNNNSKKLDSNDHSQSPTPNGSSSPLLLKITQQDHLIDYMKDRSKKRLILGLTEDKDMEAKATFEFLQLLSKLP